MVVGRGRGRGLLKGEPMEVFKEGIWLVLNSWWEIRCFDKREIEIGGNPDPKVVQLRYYLFHWFIQSKVPPSVPSTIIKLKELISSLKIDIFTYFDNSLEEVSEQLVVMYRECLKGDFSSVEIIQEANLSLARRVIGPEPVTDVPMGVFRQGIRFLMDNLLLYPLFIHPLCDSNMLQQSADYIFFWFTQTIKPLSFAYLERIIRNELYSLPIHHHLAIDASITQLVASQLMLMHEECLRGNFSSVEILRENSLYQDDKGMSEIIGVAPPPPPVPVERESNYSKLIREEEEKIRVWRQNDRENQRMLEDKDVVMGKKRKITSFIDRDISEELALALPSTTQGSKVTHTERRMFKTLLTLCRPKKDVYKGFTEASERTPPRDRPVQFESEEADSFGLDRFLPKVKKGKKAL